MQTKIIFDFQLDGHNLEYLHHLYIGASKDPDNKYIFAVPEEFAIESKLLNWPKVKNISFEYFKTKDIFKKSDVHTAWCSSVYLRKLVKKTGASEIILVWLMNVIPFLPLFISSKVKVSGIIYRIYLYTWNEASLKTKFLNVIKYAILTYSRCIKEIFILNDTSSVSVLNRIWHTDKYKFLADPYVGFVESDIRDLRKELCIDSSKIICLHPGAMSYRKGTMRIVEMIEKADTKDLEKYVFIFAGRIYPDIRVDFYQRIESLCKKAHIIVKDNFLPFEEIGNLVYTSDKILLPYNNVDMSSGSIAYAAQFSKPVYVPQNGLLGKLVRKYKIGRIVKDFADINFLNDDIFIKSNYCESHTVEIFNQTILH